MLTDAEWKELASVDLDNAFIESYIKKKDATDASGNSKGDDGCVVGGVDAIDDHCSMRTVCDSFVQTFLADDTIGTLHYLLQDCSGSLEDIAEILRRFIDNLESTRKEIDDVRTRLHRVTLQLGNAASTERVLWAVAERMVVPPQVVRSLMQETGEGLGTDFKASVKQLLTTLRRCQKETSVSLTKETRSGCRTDCNAASTTSSGGSGSSGQVGQLSRKECKVYSEQLELLTRLTVHACIKAKRYLSKKIALLSRKNTNVSIQQDHILKPYAFCSYLIDEALVLLAPSDVTNGSEQGNPDSPAMKSYYIVRTLHGELRNEYCDIMSKLYLERICDYVMTLNAMEDSGSNADRTVSDKGPAVPWAYELPLITDEERPGANSPFVLGDRLAILRNILDPPLVPAVEQAKWRLHSYEETFRSMNRLICDAVTHEFIFTYTFFSGDMSVFVEVFKPTMQFIVDYVAEVLLAQDSGRGDSVWRSLHDQYPQATVNSVCCSDCYGLLLMIRLCHDFNSLMKDVRRISCLEGFYDSLLLQLWPSFQQTFERQVRALRSCDVTALAQMLLQPKDTQGVSDWVARVHPLTKHYTAFTISLVAITNGCGFNPTESGFTRTNPLTSTSVLEQGSSTDACAASGSDAAAKDDISFEEMQQFAWRAIEAERASDMADSTSRFAVLAGNLSFLRVEVERLLRNISTSLLEITLCDPDTQHQRNLSFLLNNVHYVVSEWLAACPNGDTAIFGAEYPALVELEKTLRGDLVLEIVRYHFPLIHRALEEDEQIDVIAVAEVFHHKWKSVLKELCINVRSLMGTEERREELLAQVCTEVLLWNTRFYECVAKADTSNGSSGPSAGNFTVTNQQILQHIRSLAAVVEGG
uniref:Uncharacterized protein n=1 Tax=Trypanosoma congolense (strain IL3000) TaxID=1068625 RepID=G0UPJ6_TRYCI|nr:conserved hypothetical protein [Trypanosoma congolense IL3000]